MKLVVAVEAGRDHVVQRGDLFEQLARLGRFLVVAKRCDQLDRLAQVGEILLELLRHVGVEHGKSFFFNPPRRAGRKG
jgi:hypothetical protein